MVVLPAASPIDGPFTTDAQTAISPTHLPFRSSPLPTMRNILREVSPEELGEPTPGQPGYDADLHCLKLRVITPEMQEQERIEDKKRHGQFVDGPVQDAQERLLSLISKNNLRLPCKWFDNDSDAEIVFKAVARAYNVSFDCLGKTTMTASLCRLLDVVWKHRGLRMRNKGDPPRMSHQERRIRHWQAVIDESSLARLFSQRLVRHVTLMLVQAHLNFAKSVGRCNRNSTLNDKIDKVSGWFGENDPEDVKSFEYLHPERQEAHAPKAQGMSCMILMTSVPICMVNTAVSLAHNKRKGKRNSRKSKAATLPPWANVRQKRQRHTNTPLSATRPDQTQPPLPIPVPDCEIELPERIRKAKGGRRNR